MSVAPDLSVDGQPATPDDLAAMALVNYGAYTSFRLEEGGVRGLDLHLARLQAEAVELFGQPVGESHLRDLIRTAVKGRDAGWLRISLFAREISPRTSDWTGRPSVMVAVSPPLPPLSGGVRLQVQTYAREAAHLKHVATFGLIRARRVARAAGFDDAVFIDAEGHVSEGSLWNIGFLQGSEVIWPEALMLAGIAQQLVDRGLAGVQLTGRTIPVRLEHLAASDGAFICNSATPACAVTAIGDHAFETVPALVDRLRAAWASNPVQPI